MENVKALVSQKFLPFYQKWEQWLAEMGYDNHGKVINATECGVPQNRERIFLVSILDEDKTNNAVCNLEWCDHKYNLNYGTVKEKIGNANRNGKFWSKKISQYKDGILIATYPSAAEAERQTGISASAIRKVCLNRPRFITAGGYKWVAE